MNCRIYYFFFYGFRWRSFHDGMWLIAIAWTWTWSWWYRRKFFHVVCEGFRWLTLDRDGSWVSPSILVREGLRLMTLDHCDSHVGSFMVVCEGMRWLTLDREGSMVMSLHQSNLTFKENIETFKPWRLCLAPGPWRSLSVGIRAKRGEARIPTRRLFEVSVRIVIPER